MVAFWLFHHAMLLVDGVWCFLIVFFYNIGFVFLLRESRIMKDVIETWERAEAAEEQEQEG